MRDQLVIDRCPSLRDLVLASDGGVSPEHRTAMTDHLRQCAPCRERLRQANAFLEASADETMPVSFEDEIGARYDSHARDVARNREFARRLHKQKQKLIHRPTPAAAWVRQWLPAAALIPLLIFGVALFRLQTVVRAEELLTRASKYESSLPADHAQLLRVQFTPGIPAFASPVADGRKPDMPSPGPFVAFRHVAGGIVRDAASGGAASSGDHAATAALLSSHRFDWNQPLSLAALHAWRSSPGEKRDEVIVSSETLVLRTIASIGALRTVELTVRRADYHVIKLALAFEGTGRLEISEVEETPPRSIAVKAAPVAPLAPTMTAPVAMSTTPSSLASRGAASDASLSPVTTVVGRAPMTQPNLSRWLDRTFRASPERKTFVPTLQRLVTDVRQHLSELDILARRYPEAEVVEQWSTDDQAAFRRRVEEGYRRVSRDLNELDLHVSVLFGSQTRSFPVTEAPDDWRQRAAAALTHAESMDGDVRDLLKFDDLPSSSTDVRATGGARLPASFAALWNVVHAPAGGPASRQ